MDRKRWQIDRLLDQIKQLQDLRTEYQLGKFMGWSTSKLGNWRRGRALPSDRECVQIADVLDINPLYVIALAHEDREKDAEIKNVWRALAKMTKAACIVAALSGASGVLQSAHDDSALARGQSIHYAQQRRRRRRESSRHRRRRKLRRVICSTSSLSRSCSTDSRGR